MSTTPVNRAQQRTARQLSKKTSLSYRQALRVVHRTMQLDHTGLVGDPALVRALHGLKSQNITSDIAWSYLSMMFPDSGPVPAEILTASGFAVRSDAGEITITPEGENFLRRLQQAQAAPRLPLLTNELPFPGITGIENDALGPWALQQGEIIILAGQPGSGKTAMLHQMAADWSSRGKTCALLYGGSYDFTGWQWREAYADSERVVALDALPMGDKDLNIQLVKERIAGLGVDVLFVDSTDEMVAMPSMSRSIEYQFKQLAAELGISVVITKTTAKNWSDGENIVPAWAACDWTMTLSPWRSGGEGERHYTIRDLRVDGRQARLVGLGIGVEDQLRPFLSSGSSAWVTPAAGEGEVQVPVKALAENLLYDKDSARSRLRKQAVIDTLVHLGRELGRTPTKQDYVDYRTDLAHPRRRRVLPSVDAIKMHHRGWEAALRRAGYLGISPTQQRALDSIALTTYHIGHVPTYWAEHDQARDEIGREENEKRCKDGYSPRFGMPYVARSNILNECFGSWQEVMQAVADNPSPFTYEELVARFYVARETYKE